jgi:hypothetical protein
MIDRIAAWLQRTFTFLNRHRMLALALAILLVALVIISPIPPVP